MKIRSLFFGSVFALASLQAQAVIIFSDNFNTENGGAGVLNFGGFANWTVSSGTVDLIGNGYFDFLPGNGLYVDMDGSTGNAGKMTSAALNLTAGDYVLSYALAGNHRNGAAESVSVLVDLGIANALHALTQSAPFQTFYLNFSLLAPTSVNLVFEGAGADNIGMLLDNVSLEKRDAAGVPDTSSTAILLGLGLLGLAAVRRMKR